MSQVYTESAMPIRKKGELLYVLQVKLIRFFSFSFTQTLSIVDIKDLDAATSAHCICPHFRVMV